MMLGIPFVLFRVHYDMSNKKQDSVLKDAVRYQKDACA